MKNVACIVATAWVGAAFVTIARAGDPISQVPSVSDKLSLQDPDGTPLVITHPQTQSSSDTASENKDDQKAAANQDWLLRAYEQQLQQKNADTPGSASSNLYYRIASDKNLSKLAGVSGINSPDSGATLKTGVSRGNQSTLSLRPDASAPASSAAPTSLLTPLITPLGAADAAGLHNFYGSVPAAPAPKKSAADPADLDMPGKVAAKSNPLAQDSLAFDSLPDDTSPDKSSHHDVISQTDLPTASDSMKVQKLTDASLTAKGSTKTVTSPNVSTMQLKLVEDPPPPKLVVPNAGRQPLANPYSILDH